MRSGKGGTRTYMHRDPITIARFSTTHLPPDQRYAAWLGWGWPRADAIYRTEPVEPFDTTFDTVTLGDILFVRTEITGMRYERRVQDIRRSDFDPIIVNMMVRGFAQGVLDGREFREEAGSYHFHDLGRPSLHVSTASLTYSIVLMRPVALALLGRLDDLHGLVVAGPNADLLIAHAAQAWQAMPHLDKASAPALGRSLCDLLVAAVAQCRAAAPVAATAVSKLRDRAETLIANRLNTELTIADLCEALDVPRNALFAAFQPDGGVLNFIRAARLDLARTALADLEREEPIGTIALRLGFCDASHLSRLFRTRFGLSPRDYRRLVATDKIAQEA